MSIIAEFVVSHPGLPLMASLEAVPDLRVDVEHGIASDPERPVLFIWAWGDDFEAFETAAEDDESVDHLVPLEDLDGRRLYRAQVSDDAGLVLYPLHAEVGAARLSVSATVEGVESRLRFPDREALATYRDALTDRGADVTLHGVYSESDRSFGAVHGLSEKQREALEVAAARGYFEVPRGASLAAIADELGVSQQAASERIRRGVDALLADALD